MANAEEAIGSFYSFFKVKCTLSNNLCLLYCFIVIAFLDGIDICRQHMYVEVSRKFAADRFCFQKSNEKPLLKRKNA